MIAIRDDELAARTMGVPLARVKTLAFAWSAMYAGVAGGLSTWVIGFLSPDSFTVAVSIEFLAALVVGGLGTIFGPLFGASFLVFIPNVSQNINDAAPGIAFGALLILAMYVAPGGVAGVLRNWWIRLVAASTPRPSSTPPAEPPPPGGTTTPAQPRADDGLTVDAEQ
jgi:branched-chain amino acid transport system permease protein